MKKLFGILMALVLALALLPTTVFAAEEVAKIDDGTTFETLEAAVKAVKEGGTVTLLKSTTGCGIGTFRAPKEGQIAAKSFTIDFGGFTYTVTDPAVGSTGTETQGFHLEWSGNGDANHNVTLKNGTIEAAKGTKNVMMLVQNYCNLTLENLTVDGRNLVNGWGTYTYVISNNCGSTTISNSRIIANPGSVAFDVDGARKGYTAAKVIVKNSTVDGKIEKSENNDLVIMSGTFSQDVSAFMDPSVGTVEKVDGKYIVKRVVPAAAKIGDKEYESLAEAVAAAKDGDTVVLQKDVTIGGYQEIRKAITVDLGGNKLTSTDGGFDVYADLTVKNGRMETVKWAAWVQSGADLVIEKDVSIMATSTEGNKGGITVQNEGSSVTVFGKVEAAGGAAISGIGNKNDGGVIINIEEGAVITCTNENGLGIYYPNTAALNIKGGTITGATGVYVKSGKTTVTGGTIIGTGVKADYEYYGNGGNATGDAFVVDTCGYPGGDPVVEIKGGTFKSENAAAVGSYFGNTAEKALAGFITGGSFSSDPTKYAAADYKVTTENGVFTVSKNVPNNNDNTPSTPSTPETFDAGIAAYGVSAVLSVTGMAWMGLKKKSTTYTGKRIEK
ncbi:MAG: hypothetical protein EGQ48_04355 [Clostridiales bacterium]|nr:hypothetical protein [Clostridiales bacterium]